MGCFFSKKTYIVQTTQHPDIGNYVNIFESNFKYLNPTHYNEKYKMIGNFLYSLLLEWVLV